MANVYNYAEDYLKRRKEEEAEKSAQQNRALDSAVSRYISSHSNELMQDLGKRLKTYSDSAAKLSGDFSGRYFNDKGEYRDEFRGDAGDYLSSFDSSVAEINKSRDSVNSFLDAYGKYLDTNSVVNIRSYLYDTERNIGNMRQMAAGDKDHWSNFADEKEYKDYLESVENVEKLSDPEYAKGLENRFQKIDRYNSIIEDYNKATRYQRMDDVEDKAVLVDKLLSKYKDMRDYIIKTGRVPYPGEGGPFRTYDPAIVFDEKVGVGGNVYNRYLQNLAANSFRDQIQLPVVYNGEFNSLSEKEKIAFLGRTGRDQYRTALSWLDSTISDLEEDRDTLVNAPKYRNEVNLSKYYQRINEYKSKKDFAENSKPKSSQDALSWFLNSTSETKNFATNEAFTVYAGDPRREKNGVEKLQNQYARIQKEGYDRLEKIKEGVEKYYDKLTEDDKAVYYYILNTEGKDAAYSYLEGLETILGQRKQQERIEDAENGSLSWLKARGYNFLNLFRLDRIIEDVGGLFGAEVNPYSKAHEYELQAEANDYAAQKWAADVSKDWQFDIIPGENEFIVDLSGLLPKTLEIGGSVVDNVARLPMKKFGLPLMALDVYSRSLKEGYERGLSQKQAVSFALASGINEALFEYVSLDKLLKSKNITSARKFFKELLSQAGVEASEEVATSIANNIADKWINGADSKYNTEVHRLMSEKNLSAADARIKAGWDQFGDVIMDGVGGFVSGGVLGAGGSAINYSRTVNAYASPYMTDGKIDPEKVKTLQDRAERVTANPKVFSEYMSESEIKTLSKALNDVETSEKVGKGKVARLAEAYQTLFKNSLAKSLSSSLAKNSLEEAFSKDQIGEIADEIFSGMTPEQIAERYSAQIGDKTGEFVNAVDSSAQNATADVAMLFVKAGNTNTGETDVETTGEETAGNPFSRAITDADIVDIVSNNNGKMRVKVNVDGETRTVPLSDVSMSDDAAEVYSGVQSMGIPAETAKKIVESYKLPADITPENAVSYARSYVGDARSAYEFGKINYEAGLSGLTSLSATQARDLYDLGRIDALKNAEKENRSRKQKIADIRKATDDDIRAGRLSSDQKTVVSLVNMIDSAVEFIDTEETEGFRSDGYVDNDGIFHIDKNTVDPLSFVIKHELAHFSEESKEYKAFHDVVINSKAFEKWINGKVQSKGSLREKISKYRQNKINQYAEDSGNTVKLSPVQAEREMIGNFAGDVFFSESGLEGFIKELDAQKMGKVRSFLRAFFDWLKSRFGGKLPAEIRYLERMYVKVIENAAEEYGENADAKKEFSFAEKEKELVRAFHKEFQTDGDPVDIRKEAKFSISENDKLMDAAENFAEQKNDHKYVSSKELSNARKQRDAVAERMKRNDISKLLPPDETTKEWQSNAERKANTFVTDSAYGGTEESAMVCVRSLLTEQMIDYVSERFKRPLTVKEQVLLAQYMLEQAETPECVYCYVAMDRKAFRQYLMSFVEQADGIIKNYEDGMSDEENYKYFLGGRKDSSMSKNKYNMKTRFDLVLNAYKDGVRIENSDLVGAENSSEFRYNLMKDYNNLSKKEQYKKDLIDHAVQYAQSASWAKKRRPYIAYDGHILRWTQNRINMLNSSYGLRFYSFSDYSPAFVLENMQMITDAAVRGLKGLAYTKELDFVRIFASTGININISCFGSWNAKTEEAVEDSIQGAKWKEAAELRKQHKNVGITFVATNDNMVEWALAQDWIDVVIPFHLVRTGADAAKYLGYENYTYISSNTRDSKKRVDPGFKGIYPPDHHNDKATFLRLCKENGLKPRFERWVNNPNYMKLVNETRLSFDESQVMKPVFDVGAAEASLDRFVKEGGYYKHVGGNQDTAKKLGEEFTRRLSEIPENERRFSIPEKLESLRRQTADASDEWDKLREQKKEIEYSDEYEKWVTRLSDDPSEENFAAYRKWEEDKGIPELFKREKEARVKYLTLQKEYSEAVRQAKRDADQKEFEASGLSEADYHRKKAEKEFGYTPYFYDAGYILPNGRMLNLSGEKGKHFGTRGQDHRAIGVIYNGDESGSEKMLKFMGEGNIRIMDETPGLDISSTSAPTKTQYDTISRFVTHSKSRGYFAVDFSDENGNVVGTLQYEGTFGPMRVLNDIRHFYQTGEIRQQSELSKFYQYSIPEKRNTEYMKAVADGDMKKAQQMVNEEADKYLNEMLLPDDSDEAGFKYHRGPAPKKTFKRYAVLNVSPDGFRAAYAGNKNPTPLGVWLDAQNLPSYMSDMTQFDDGSFATYILGDTGAPAGNKFSEELLKKYGLSKSSKLLLERGGKHSSDVPNFSQMNLGQDENGNKVSNFKRDGALPHNKLIFEIEYGISDDGDLTEYVNQNGRKMGGRNQGLRTIQPNQYYDFKTNPNAVGKWGIGGTFRITRLVPYSEVVKATNDYKENAVNEALSLYKSGDISKADMNKRIANAEAIQIQKWVGGYHPEDFGLTVENVDEAVRQGYSKKLLDPVTYDDDGNVIPLRERFNSKKNDIRYSIPEKKNKKLLERYSEKQYNDYGWVAYNKVLTGKELKKLYSTFADIKNNKNKALKNRKGEYLILTGDGFNDIDSLTYISGTNRHPIIRQVIKINFEAETTVKKSIFDEVIKDEIERRYDDAFEIYEAYAGQRLFDRFTIRSSLSYSEAQEREGERNGEISVGKDSGWNAGERVQSDTERKVSSSNTAGKQRFQNLTQNTNTSDTKKRSIPDRAKKLRQDFIDGKISLKELREGEIALSDEAREQYGTIERGEKARAEINVPKQVENDKVVGKFVRTILETGSANLELMEEMGERLLQGEYSHTVATDENAISYAERVMNAGNQTAEVIWKKTVENEKKVPGKNDIAVGERLLTEAMNAGETERALEIASDLVEVFTRAGQNLQAAKLLKMMTGPGRLVHLQRMVSKINALEAGKKNFTPIMIPKTLATELANAKTPEDVEFIANEINQEIADQMPVTLMDKWNAWRYMAMLTNPVTHIRNIVGNAIFAPSVLLKNKLAAAAESVFIKDRSKRTKSVKIKKKYKDFANQILGTSDAANALSDNGKYSEESKLRMQRRIFKNGLLEWVRVGNGKLLENEDMFFKNRYFVSAFAGFLQARNVDITKPISESVMNAAIDYASAEAKKNTYNDENTVSKALNYLRNNYKHVGLALDAVVPFRRTPVNIVKRGIEYSPIGLIRALSYGSYQLKTGKISATEFIEGLSAGGSGTAVFLLGMLLRSLGYVVGGLDDDDKEDKLRKLAGDQEYSLNLFGKSYTLDWAAPLNIPFFMGVELMGDLIKKDEDLSISDVSDTAFHSLDPIINLSMLEGIQNVLNAAKYSEGSEIIGSMAESALVSYVSQGLPTIGGRIGSAIDDTRRSNYIDKSSEVPSVVQRLINNIYSKIPGLSSERIAYIDSWGRTNTTGGVAERLVESFVSPGYFNDVDYTDVDMKLLDIYRATDDGGVIPSSAAKYFTVNGEKKDLSAKEYEQYAILKGQWSFAYAKELFDGYEYADLSDNDYADLIKKLYEYANAKAKAEVSDYSIDGSSYKSAYQAEQSGQSVVEFYVEKLIDSRHTSAMINSYLASGDTAKAKEEIDAIIDRKVSTGKTKDDARSSIQSALTSYWKTIYREAAGWDGEKFDMKKRDEKRMREIRELLYSTGIYKDVSETCQNWLKK